MRHFIRQAYAYQVSGMEHLDVNATYSYTTDDYHETDRDGITLNKNMAIHRVYGVFQQAASVNGIIRIKHKIKRLDIVGNTATVIISAHIWLQAPNPDPSQLPRQVDLSGGTARDIWVRTPTGWAIQKSDWVSDGE